ncbi:hypothetical protein EV356DRAFT_505657 [Viridothelium virens]|uniref:Myb-like domain-containing protein n=1 Tax=Viridothelium virens TaxID=1048519 RepID=A0A6A6H2E1_VIRVR|nr:hypothetical protein EV356DRAFT_505657 [Viridothelium virens]
MADPVPGRQVAPTVIDLTGSPGPEDGRIRDVPLEGSSIGSFPSRYIHPNEHYRESDGIAKIPLQTLYMSGSGQSSLKALHETISTYKPANISPAYTTSLPNFSQRINYHQSQTGTKRDIRSPQNPFHNTGSPNIQPNNTTKDMGLNAADGPKPVGDLVRIRTMESDAGRGMRARKQLKNPKLASLSQRVTPTSTASNISDAGTAAEPPSASSDSDEPSETNDLLSSFQHGSELQEPPHKKVRRALNVTDGPRAIIPKTRMTTRESSKPTPLAISEPYSKLPQESPLLGNANVLHAPSVSNIYSPIGKKSPLNQQLHYKLNNTKEFKTPPAFDDEDKPKALSPPPVRFSTEPSRPGVSKEQPVRPAPFATSFPGIEETPDIPAIPHTSKFSDFADKESDGFKNFLEQRKKGKRSKQESRKGQPWDKEENGLLSYLKGDRGLQWPEIADYFPGRSKESIQVHWCTKLAPRRPTARRKGSRRDSFKEVKVALRSQRKNRPTSFALDPLSDADIESSSASSPAVQEQGKETGSDQNSSDPDPDDRTLQFSVSWGQNPSAIERLSESEQSSSIDSLLGPGEKASDILGDTESDLQKGHPNTQDPESKAAMDPTWQQNAYRSTTNIPIFQFLNRTDDQINEEKERRRHIPRRRASNRPLLFRSQASSLGSFGDLQARYELQHQDKFFAPRHRSPASLGRPRKRVLNSSSPYPYLSFKERRILTKGLTEAEWDMHASQKWQGVAFHVDFSDRELHELKNCLQATDVNLKRGSALYYQLTDAGRQLKQEDVAVIASHASRRSALRHRTDASIGAFLEDLCAGVTSRNPASKYIGPSPSRDSALDGHGDISSILQDRELGGRPGRRPNTGGKHHHDLRSRMLDTFGPSCSFTGTSGDVHTVAWAPDGGKFAVGSVATTDPTSMQYNRPNNLLLGDVEKKRLWELPEHTIQRSRPKTGINASEAMRVSQDPRLFMTVTMVNFSTEGNSMFSAGYDNCVRVWDVTSGIDGAVCTNRLEHKAPVDVIAVGDHGVLATGSQRTNKSIKVIRYGSNGLEKCHSYSSNKAFSKPEARATPSCLKWGIHWAHSKFLLAGFASTTTGDKMDAYGETCLWNVETGQSLSLIKNTPAVFDCAWNPIPSRRASFFAVGSAAPLQGVNRGTHSVVRFYDPATPAWDRYRCTDEFECPAYDMNDVVWCPYDENLIATSCTNGKTYLWDIRKRDLLSTLRHGKSLMPLDESQLPEFVDTGVRFCSWGPYRERLYTGSSDGRVRAWNPYVAPDDMHVRDIAQLDSGVMSGAFSPDYSKLLVGEVNGSINLLSVGEAGRKVKNTAKFKVEQLPLTAYEDAPTVSQNATSGVKVAKDLVSSGEIALRPMGPFPIRQAVQGPNYDKAGPKGEAGDAAMLRAHARAFQADLAEQAQTQNRGLPCSLHNTERLFQYTEEEREDSKRSLDRIPHALRSAAKQSSAPQTVQSKSAVPAIKQCSNCGRAARPRVNTDWDDKVAFCEVCSFTCLRCPATAVVHPEMDTVECFSCGVTWRADILGYSIQKGRMAGTSEKPAMLYTPIDRILQAEGADEESFDEMEEYFHSLWQHVSDSPL